MFLKTYTYKVKKDSIEKLIETVKKAETFYHLPGFIKSEYAMRKDADFYAVKELHFYENERYFIEAQKMTKDIKELNELYDEYMTLLYDSQIEEEKFITF